jgi:F0F1-type ATP synthase membrane subunit b/b'
VVTCEICGKEFKNTQGLRGHKNFVHSDRISYTRQPVAQQLSSELEQPVTKLELLELKLQLLETKLEQVASIVQQANELAETVQLKEREVPSHTHSHLHSHSKFGYDSEHSQLLEQVDERMNKLLNEQVSKLKNEFVKKIDEIDLRLRKLEPPSCTVLEKPR